MKKIGAIIITAIIFCGLIIDVFKTQEMQWSKYDLANAIGDFENAYCIDDSRNTKVWVVKQNGEKYIVEMVGDILKRMEEI